MKFSKEMQQSANHIVCWVWSTAKLCKSCRIQKLLQMSICLQNSASIQPRSLASQRLEQNSIHYSFASLLTGNQIGLPSKLDDAVRAGDEDRIPVGDILLRVRYGSKSESLESSGSVSELKGSIGEGSNLSNLSHQSSVKIMSKFSTFVLKNIETN